MSNMGQASLLENFFREAADQAITYPREIMLAEGGILIALIAALFFFFAYALIRNSAVSGTAAGMIGMAGLMEALAFGRLSFLPNGSELIIEGFFVATVLLFLAMSVRIARDNMVLGALILLSVIAVGGLGIAGYFGFLNAQFPMLICLCAVAVFGTLLTLFAGFGGDKRAMLVAPGIMLASASMLALWISTSMGDTGWVGAMIPHIMLSGGLLLASLFALLPVGATKKKAVTRTMPDFDNAVPAFSDNEIPQEALEELQEIKDPEPAEKAEPVRAELVEEEVKPAKKKKETITEEPQIKGEPPVSSIWGKKTEEKKEEPVKEDKPDQKDEPKVSAPIIAAAAKASTKDWSWKSEQKTECKDEVVALVGVSAAEQATPENVRSLVHADYLEQYDEHILGGGDPASGDFDIILKFTNSGIARLQGERVVDEEGFLVGVEANFEKLDDKKAKKLSEELAKLEAEKQRAERQKEIDALTTALAEKKIRTYFQPIVRLDDGEIIGFEALARWQQEEGEALSASTFINTAVEAGVESEIIRTVVKEAARELSAWVTEQPDLGQFVSFNVTADSLVSDDLVDIVRDEIKKNNLPAGSLVVELTESHVLHDFNKALKVAKALKNAGARLALDDLGAGNSDLNRLSKLPVEILKTDRSLVENLMDAEQGEKTLAGIMGLAKKVGARLVVEGVETQDMAKKLKAMECDLAQGYYFGEPEAAEQSAEEEQDLAETTKSPQPIAAELR